MGKNMGRMAYSKLNSIIRQVEDIRKQWQFRMDADSEPENKNQNQSGKKKKTALGTRLPYGLCKDLGIDTTGMTPREAWDAYYGKTGVSKKEAFEEKIESGDKDIDPEEPSEEADKDLEETPDDSDDYDWSEEELKAYEDLKKLLGKDMPPLPGTEPVDKGETESAPAAEEEKETPKEEVSAPEEGKKTVNSSEKAVELDIPYQSPMMQEYASKVPKPKMDTSVKSLSGWGQVAADFADISESNYGNVLGCTTAEELIETQKKFQAIVDNAELCCNVNSEFLENIVTDHLKNQFETGTTDGSNNLHARRSAASNMFDLGKTKAEDREKYGYMADREDYETTFGMKGPGYGYNGNGSACCIVFKKDKMAERTTYTASDSLCIASYSYGEMSAGAVDTTCSLEGLSFQEEIGEKLRSGEYKSIGDMIRTYDYSTKKSSGSTCYIECQYHGNVGATDIESIRFQNEHQMNNAMNGWTPEMWDALEANGVEIGFFDDDKKLVKKDAHTYRAFYGPL